MPTSTAILEDFVTGQELAETLRLSMRDFNRGVHEGRIPPPDLEISSHRRLWRRSRILAWLAEGNAGE